MKKFIILIIVSLTSVVSLFAYKTHEKRKIDYTALPADEYKEYMIIPLNDSVDGRPIYDVVFNDGKTMEKMYLEEIVNGIKTNKWVYNEDFKLCDE